MRESLPVFIKGTARGVGARERIPVPVNTVLYHKLVENRNRMPEILETPRRALRGAYRPARA